jgi:hypothetical protein
MKQLVPIPDRFLDQLKKVKATGIGYQVVAIKLKDGRAFDQVAASDGHIIEVRGHGTIPFTPEEVESVVVNHKDWNFRRWSDAKQKAVINRD